MQPRKTESPESAVVAPMRKLIQRLSLKPHSRPTQIVTFIAARSREGTSTVSRDYAVTLASETGQKVLVIDAGLPEPGRSREYGGNPLLGIVDAMLAGKSPGAAIHPIDQGICVGRWIGDDKNRAVAGKVIHNGGIWEALSDFDTIVIDAPCLQSSFDGVALAARADAVILVVEAEKTPEPVVRNLRDTLTASGAKIAGVVMNKRRFYIPDEVYDRL